MNPITNAKIVSVDTDPALYHSIKGSERGDPEFIMSNTEAKGFVKCPHKWKKGGFVKPSTASQEWGNLVDCVTLTPDRLETAYAVSPDSFVDSKGKTKPWDYRADDRKAWKAEQLAAGKLVVTPTELAEARKAAQALHEDEQIGFLLANSRKQVFVMGEYHDKDTGLAIPVKCLIDIVPDLGLEFWSKTLADLKTDRDAAVRPWPRKVFFWGLHVQAGLYLDVYTAATGEDRTDFLHAISESEPPYEPGRALLTAGSQFDFVEEGRRAYGDAFRLYCRCLKENRWPGYADMAENKIHGFPICQPEAWMIGGGPVMPEAVDPDEDSDEPKMDKDDIMP